MAQEKHILIVCGEPSGDLSAAGLARAIKETNPALRICAVGGQLLRSSGAEIFYDIKDLSCFGLFDALKNLPKFFALKKLILRKIQDDAPDLIILVDFSGFNLRLAKAINNRIPVIYYISPQVWASRKGRLETIKKYIKKMVVIFKFEEEFYQNHGIDAAFAGGHPLLDIVGPGLSKEEFLKKSGLSQNKTTVALLPGSRSSEIKNILPVMLKTARLLQKQIRDIQFIVAKSPQVAWKEYRCLTSGMDNIDLEIIEGKTYECLNAAHFALVCSGTATLETAIMEKPFLIVYKMGLLNYLLYRPMVKVPYIGMVNIIAGRKIIPEFIQFGASADKIATEALRILQNPSAAQEMKINLAQVKTLLGKKGASSRAAQIILNTL